MPHTSMPMRALIVIAVGAGVAGGAQAVGAFVGVPVGVCPLYTFTPVVCAQQRSRVEQEQRYLQDFVAISLFVAMH